MNYFNHLVNRRDWYNLWIDRHGDIEKLVSENLLYTQQLLQVGSWTYHLQKNSVFWSEGVCEILEIEPTALTDKRESFLKYVHPDDREHVDLSVQNSSENTSMEMDYRVITGKDNLKYIREKTMLVKDEASKMEFVIGVIQDITNQKQIERNLRVFGEDLNIAQRIAEIGSWKYHVNKNKLYVTEEMCRIFNMTAMEFDQDQEKAYHKIHPEDQRLLLEFVEDQQPGRTKELEYRILGPDRSIKYIVTKSEPIFDDQGELEWIFGTLQDITTVKFKDAIEKIEMEKRLDYIYTHDILTDLPNKIHYLKNLDQVCAWAEANGANVTLFVLDIDGLKHVLYSLGYELEDRLILAVVERLKNYTNENRFLSRHSDDHFVITALDMKESREYEEFAGSLIRLFEEPFEIGDYQVDLAVNIGVASFPNDGQSAEDLRNNGRTALMRAKREGKNKYQIYSADLNVQSYREFILRSDIHKAIENQQLEVLYKPIVNANINEIMAGEAIIQWHHPEWGSVPLEDFLYLAEETGTIIDIGRWALKEIAKDLLKWRLKRLKNIKIMLHFSPVQFFEKDFVEKLQELVNEMRMDPAALIIEIDEKIFNHDVHISEDLEKIKEFGPMVAIDDFGTGFLSLKNLSNLKVDILRIGDDFVKSIGKDNAVSMTTNVIVNLAKDLRLKLVADGVEKYSQLHFLKSLNCFAIGGEIYSGAVNKEAFEDMLKEKTLLPKAVATETDDFIEERRKYFRIPFVQLLKTEVTVLSIKGKETKLGSSKALIRNIGPGGLCLISNISFPIDNEIKLRFITKIMGTKLVMDGYPVWSQNLDAKTYQIGIKFTMNESEQVELVKVLNTVQIRMRRKDSTVEGDFTDLTYTDYFSPN